MCINFLFMGNKLSVQQLEKALKERGMRKSDFLETRAISKQRYQNWKSRGIPANELPGIAHYMKISIDELMGNKPPNIQHKPDRQDIHELIERLPPRLLSKARAALEFFVVEDPASINQTKAVKKKT